MALAAVSPLPFELFAVDLRSCYTVSPTAPKKAPIKLSEVGLIRYMTLDGSPDQSVGQNVNGLITAPWAGSNASCVSYILVVVAVVVVVIAVVVIIIS